LIDSCQAPCTLWLPRGKYRVRVESEGVPRKTRKIDLFGATRVYSQAGNSSRRWTGLTLGITGSAVAAIGLAVVLLGDPCNTAECSDSEKNQDHHTGVALAVAGIGAVVGTIGWIMFAGTGTKMQVQGEGAPALKFGIAPLPGGGGTFGLSGQF
jgi:hypothetical protein